MMHLYMRIAGLLAVLAAPTAALAAPNAAPAAQPQRPAAVAPASTTAPAKTAVPAKPAADVRVVVAAPRTARLAAQMDGRLVTMPRQVGTAFKKGELLAEFDCSTQRAEQDMARARADKAARVLESQQQLAKLQATSELDLSIAKADVAEAQARLQQTGVSVGKCRLLAPYAGRVVRNLANEFESLPAGTPVLEIIEAGTLKLEFVVPSMWLRWLKIGQAFSVRIDELGREVPAKVTGLGSRVDPVSQTISVTGQMTGGTNGVLPGMSGVAIFPEAAR